MSPRADAFLLAGLGLVVRIAVVVWAAGRFPPTEDGHFYHIVARRIAAGHGYTWVWPDGAVTYAAHYPVGYPALVGSLYALFGAAPWVAMTLNAVLGAAAVFAAQRLASLGATRRGALIAGFGVALHPALVFYTPALMTEGVTAALVTLAAWIASRDRRLAGLPWARLIVLGLVTGAATLVRPQSLLLAPLFGLLVPISGRGRRLLVAASTAAVTLAVCLPWTARNCARLERCVFVSANGGWNLLIGAGPGATGSWVPIEQVGFPESCREVFGEADKDRCFRRAALAEIAEAPGRWLSLVPAKLAATFDFGGAPGWYLHASNPAALTERGKILLGAVETFWQRLLVALALAAAARARGPRRGARLAVALASGLSLLWLHAWIAYLGFVASVLLLGRRLIESRPLAAAAACVGVTAVVHAVFFGAGRYSLVTFPLLAVAAGTVLTPRRSSDDTRA